MVHTTVELSDSSLSHDDDRLKRSGLGSRPGRYIKPGGADAARGPPGRYRRVPSGRVPTAGSWSGNTGPTCPKCRYPSRTLLTWG